jgi:hypothetical protein
MGTLSMSLLSDIALEHQARRIRLAQVTANRARAVWGRADVEALEASWSLLAPTLTAQVVASQVTAARQSAPYLNQVAAASGDSVDRAVLNASEFGGWMSDGREVGPALFGAVTTTKKAIGAGMAPRLAFEAGAAFLATLIKAAVSDMGRAADSTLATGKGYTRYVRVVNPGACSRCAILAGSDRYSTNFKRHPACKCTTLPIKDPNGIPKGLFSSPEEYFESLSKAEQSRVFTKAGAESIRLGADPIGVVNARRGAYLRPGGMVPRKTMRNELGFGADGKPIQVFTTSEGTTVRGSFGRQELRRAESSVAKGAGDRYRRTVNPRLMPETILQIARGDQELAKTLLRQYGYLR